MICMGVSAFEYVESLLPHCRQVQVAQQTALRCVAQSAVGTRQSAVRRGGRRPSPSPAVVVLHAALYRLQYRLFVILYAYGTRTHGFLRYGFTLFKHGLRISLHEIHT